MRRKCTDNLILWKKNPSRKPLILQGGRQTGKTWLLRDFGSRQYETTVYLNLETERPAAEYLSVPREAEDALLFLETYANTPIRQSSTLVILDNIQCVPQISRLLSAISLDFPGYHITAIERGFSGNYDTHDLELLRLYPLDFEEFLWANTEYNLAKEIRGHFTEKKPMGRQLHEKAMAQFHLYQIIGGMPDAILEYRKEKKLLMVPDVQQKTLALLQADIASQAPSGLARHCLNCWKSIPSQLGKTNSKFQYRQITKSGTARLYQEPLKWLVETGLVLCAFKCGEKIEYIHDDSLNHVQTLDHLNAPPLKHNQNLGALDETSFHLYFPDTGLTTCHLGIPSYLLLTGESTPATQACTETYLAQHFSQNSYNIFYWSSGNQAEVPFILEKDGNFTAVDCRLTPHQKARSLMRLSGMCDVDKMYLVSAEDFKVRENYEVIPFYSVFCL